MVKVNKWFAYVGVDERIPVNSPVDVDTVAFPMTYHGFYTLHPRWLFGISSINSIDIGGDRQISAIFMGILATPQSYPPRNKALLRVY